jgi:hypothetical protein
VWLKKGEFLIVHRGLEHRPVADEEAHVMLFEPAGTLNTGDVYDERMVEGAGKPARGGETGTRLVLAAIHCLGSWEK